ncbi:hypothetical protein WDW89_05145 [Deltaproteobacteria bacterium TL4]
MMKIKSFLIMIILGFSFVAISSGQGVSTPEEEQVRSTIKDYIHLLETEGFSVKFYQRVYNPSFFAQLKASGDLEQLQTSPKGEVSGKTDPKQEAAKKDNRQNSNVPEMVATLKDALTKKPIWNKKKTYVLLGELRLSKVGNQWYVDPPR